MNLDDLIGMIQVQPRVEQDYVCFYMGALHVLRIGKPFPDKPGEVSLQQRPPKRAPFTVFADTSLSANKQVVVTPRQAKLSLADVLANITWEAVSAPPPTLTGWNDDPFDLDRATL